jgi:hypothetical protein
MLKRKGPKHTCMHCELFCRLLLFNTCNCVHIKFIFNELYKQQGTRVNPEAVNRQADLSRQMPAFSPKPAHVGFVTDKFGLGQVFIRVFRLYTVSPRSFICHRRYVILLVDSIVI